MSEYIQTMSIERQPGADTRHNPLYGIVACMMGWGRCGRPTRHFKHDATCNLQFASRFFRQLSRRNLDSHCRTNTTHQAFAFL